jgi:putative CocE/NonD family hydrolase
MPISELDQPYDLIILKDLKVPMRDGVRLSTDVYLPAREGQIVPGTWPTILGRTSYDKEADWLWVKPVAKYFVPRGYAVVVQDLRGRHQSEGRGQYFHVVNPREGPDGYDTVEWIAAQPWSSGRVGTVGTSHGAVVQAAMALHRPPHLTAMWLDDGFWNWFRNGARQGGALELDTLGMMFLHGHDSHEAAEDPNVARAMADAAQHLRDWVMRMPLKPGCSPLSLIPSLEQIFFEYFCRGDEDEFWRQDCINFAAHLDRFADAPTVIRCGWYDVFALTNGAIYPRLVDGRKGPFCLILGPWVHMGCERSWAGDVDFGPDAALDGINASSANELRLRWFDRWLKDVANGVDDEPPVRIFVMGGGSGRKNREGRLEHGGRWRSEAEWPLRRARPTAFYFHYGGLLTTDQPGPTDPPASYRFDPDHPVPTISANVASYYEHLPVPDGILPAMAPPRSRMRSIVLQGPSNQREALGILGCRPPYSPIAARPDVLVFQTPPLDRDVEVTGPIVVKLWISSTAPDTDFTAMLLDVYPPNEDYLQGYDLNLCDGIQRARYRDGYDRARFMTPGEVYPITIELGPTSNLFKAGHRIRVHVSSSNFPRFDVNPNTGGPLGSAEGAVIAHNTIYLDASRPSHIVLPIAAE